MIELRYPELKCPICNTKIKIDLKRELLIGDPAISYIHVKCNKCDYIYKLELIPGIIFLSIFFSIFLYIYLLYIFELLFNLLIILLFVIIGVLMIIFLPEAILRYLVSTQKLNNYIINYIKKKA